MSIRPFVPGSTTWRLVQTATIVRLNVTLTCDTTARGVIEAIESAAAAHGIILERLTRRIDEESA